MTKKAFDKIKKGLTEALAVAHWEGAILTEQDQYDLKAEASLKMHAALRKAIKARFNDVSDAVGPLHQATGKSQSYLSKLLRGQTKSIELETLAVILEALNFDIQIDIKEFEHLALEKTPEPKSEVI